MKVSPYPHQHRCVPDSTGLASQAAANHEKATFSKYQTSLGFLNKHLAGVLIKEQSGAQSAARVHPALPFLSRGWETGLHYSQSHQHADHKGCVHVMGERSAGGSSATESQQLFKATR